MKAILGATKRFTAKVSRTSVKKGTLHDKSVCLHDITLDGVIIKDHSWVDKTDSFKNIVIGDTITFTARVAQYISLGENYEQVTKYRLVKIRNLTRV